MGSPSAYFLIQNHLPFQLFFYCSPWSHHIFGHIGSVCQSDHQFSFLSPTTLSHSLSRHKYVIICPFVIVFVPIVTAISLGQASTHQVSTVALVPQSQLLIPFSHDQITLSKQLENTHVTFHTTVLLLTVTHSSFIY